VEKKAEEVEGRERERKTSSLTVQRLGDMRAGRGRPADHPGSGRGLLVIYFNLRLSHLQA
jgi:hypothetical protein